MNEYVKAFKTIHHLLIIACSAILAFALTADSGPQYENAENTLKLLDYRDASTDSWSQYLGALPETQLTQNETKDKTYIRNVLYHFDHSISPENISIESIVYNPPFPLTGNVGDIVNRLKAQQTIQLGSLRPEPEALYKEWNDALKGVDVLKTPPKIMRAKVTSPPAPAGDTVDYKNALAGQTAALIIWIDPGSVLPAVVGNNNVVTLYPDIQLDPPLKDYYAAQWLKRYDNKQVLEIPKAGIPSFPELRAFNNEISASTARDARSKLAEDEREHPSEIALFGISVDADLTVEVLPWVTSGLLFYFLAYLRQCRLTRTVLSDSSTPWVGFFTDWVGRSVALVTILIMPFVTSWVLVKIHGHFKRPQIIALSSVAILSIWACAELLALRRKLDGRPTSAPPDATLGAECPTSRS